MARWKTDEIKALLEQTLVDRLEKIEVDEPGGDYDTEAVVLDFGLEG